MAVSPTYASNLGFQTSGSVADHMNMGQNHEKITLGSLVSELSNFFGPGDNKLEMGAYDDQRVVTYHLPDVMKGRQMFIRDTIVGLVTRNNEWYTTLCLPWLQTQEQAFRWTEFQFNQTLAGEVPPEGVPRLMTSQATEYSQGTTRRGLAFLLEAEFFKSKQGQEMYRRNFRGIRQAIQETANLDVSFSISSARKRYQEYEAQKGQLQVEISKLAHIETWCFAIMQKGKSQFDLMLGRLKDAMGEYNVVPNIMIVPPGTGRYYGQVTPERTQYVTIGPTGELEPREGPRVAGSIDGLLLVETRRMAVSRVSAPTEPFVKTIRHGTYVPMIDTLQGGDYKGFRHSARSVMVWDETACAYTKLHIRDAILYSHRYNADGTLRSEHYELARKANDAGRVKPGNNSNNIGAYNPMMVGNSIQDMTAQRLASEFRDMFLYKRNDGDFGVVDFFGLMDFASSSDEDFRVIAEIAASQLYDGRDSMTRAQKALRRLDNIVMRSESIPYSQQFWVELLKENMSRQKGGSATDPTFGQLTAEDITAARGLPRQLEMVPNDWGCVDFPFKSASRAFNNWTVPPHVNSWPAICTLVSMKGSSSGWDSVIEDLEEAKQVIEDIISKGSETFGSTMFMRASLRPQWFQRPEKGTVLVHDVVLQPRDGVFAIIPRTFYDADPLQRGETSAADPKNPENRYKNSVEQRIPEQTSQDLFNAILGNDNLIQVMQTIAGLFDEKAANSYTFFLLFATNLINTQSFSDDDAKGAIFRARRLVRYFGGVLARAETQAAAIATIRAQIDKLVNLFGGEEVTPADIATATKDLNRIMARQIHEVTVDNGKVTLSKDIVEASEKDAQPNDLQLRGLNTWAQLEKEEEGNGEEGIDLTPLPGKEDDEKEVTFSAGDYEKALVIRVPLNSYYAFAVSALALQQPLALPSDPNKAHMAPLTGATPMDALKVIFERPHYAQVADRLESVSDALTVAESSIEWQMPENVWNVSGPSSVEAIAASRGKGKKNPRSEDSYGGDDDDDSGSRFSGLLGTMFTTQTGSTDESQRKRQKEFDLGLPDRDTEPKDRTQEYTAQDERQRRQAERWDSSGGFSHGNIGGGRGGTGKDVPGVAARMPANMIKPTFGEVHTKFSEAMFVSRWKYGQNISNPVTRIFHQMFLGCQNTFHQMLDLVNTHNNPPCGAIAWRLDITRKMAQIVVMVGGYDTGATMYGNTDVQAGDDVVTKVILCNVTFYMGAIIINPMNINIAEAAIAKDYLFGHGTQPVVNAKDVRWKGMKNVGDIIFTLIPQRETLFPNPMNFYGQHVLPDLNPDILSPMERRMHYTSAAYYELVFGLKKYVTEIFQTDKDPRYGRTNIDRPQFYAYKDWYSAYDASTKNYTAEYKPVEGHLGPTGTGPYAAKALRGQDTQFGNDIGWHPTLQTVVA